MFKEIKEFIFDIGVPLLVLGAMGSVFIWRSDKKQKARMNETNKSAVTNTVPQFKQVETVRLDTMLVVRTVRENNGIVRAVLSDKSGEMFHVKIDNSNKTLNSGDAVVVRWQSPMVVENLTHAKRIAKSQHTR